MANFNTHLSVAGVASVTLATAGIYVGFISVGTAIFCALLGTIGGLLPDIDLHYSRPAKKGFYWASIFLATLMAVLYASYQTGVDRVVHALVLWAVAFCVLKFGIFELFNRLTVHRGVVHSVPYMAVFGLLTVYGVFYGLKMTAFVSWVFGFFVFIGALVHLLLDEWYSVNLLGMKLKKSSGTAFKFFEKNKPLHYAVLYALVIVLWLFAPDGHAFWKKLSTTMMSFFN